MTYGEAGHALGVHPNSLRYAAPTGTVLIRWDGRPAADRLDGAAARRSTRESPARAGPPVPACLRPHDARAFARWAGIVSARAAAATFGALRRSLTAVHTPIGDAWILTADEPAFRADPRPAAPARLLPSGDAYFLLHGDDRALLVPDADRRSTLWTPRVWPGAVLLDGEIRGTWRRAHDTVTIQAWGRPSRAALAAVETEAAALPLPGIQGRIMVRFSD